MASGSEDDPSLGDQEAEAIAGEELEAQLVAVGKKLAYPPSDANVLIALLSKAESLLLRVDQLPPESLRNSLYYPMKALASKELVSHPLLDVRITLASCFSEITRITAPTDPYGENTLKDVFRTLVDAFRNLDDLSSRLYPKRISLLQNFADLRFCMLMLDCEFYDLILEMFQHFLNTIRSCHTANVFSLMETIMTQTLNASDDIPSEILHCLLSYVKPSNTDVSPIARNLAEEVIGNCTLKLNPYLDKYVQNTGVPFSDDADMVAPICQENSNTSDLGIVPTPKSSEARKREKLYTDDISKTYSLRKHPRMTKEGITPSPKSSKPRNKDKFYADDSSKTYSLRKHRRTTEEDSKKDKELVGSKIKVWWPDDKMFYEGVVASFNPATKKHRVEYDDGDVEILLLKDERWEFLEVESNIDGGQGIDSERTDFSSEKLGDANIQPNSDSTAKQRKNAKPLKRQSGAVKAGGNNTNSVYKRCGFDAPRTRRPNLRASKLVNTSSDESFEALTRSKGKDAGKYKHDNTETSSSYMVELDDESDDCNLF